MKRTRVLPAALFAVLSLCALRVTAADNVRIVAAQAAVHLNADPNSLTVTTVPAGTVLELDGRQGPWYGVWLPADRPGGARRLGFVAASDAEVVTADGGRPPSGGVPQASLPDAPAQPPARQGSSGDFDGFGGATFNLPGARAFVAVPGGSADSGEHNVLPTFGFALGGWISRTGTYGFFFDFSGVDGGSAFAQVGNSRSDVTSSLVDFHAGWQIQKPGRVRPYGMGGVGMAFIKTTGQITLLGTRVASLDETEHHLSILLGGGVRFQVGRKWGARVGVDWIGVSMPDDQSINYGRFIAGSYYSF